MSDLTSIAKFSAIAGAIYGITGVILGAFGAHGLKSKLSPDALASYTTGTKYQIYHALLLVILALVIHSPLVTVDTLHFMKWSVYAIALGILLFSGSIYALTLFQLKFLALVTPLGGLFMIIGWGLLVVAIVKIKVD